MNSETNVIKASVVISRVIKAPVEKVYSAWTDPVQLRLWFSPNVRWKTPLIESDPKPGGVHSITMRHADGDEMRITGSYIETIPNSRISFTWKSPDSGIIEDSIVTVDLRAVPEGTEITLTHDRLPDQNMKDQVSGGWAGCLDMLEAYFEGNALKDN